MNKKIDITVTEIVSLPGSDSGDKYFFVLSYGQTKFRGKTVKGSNPKFDEKATFPFEQNIREARIEVWGNSYRGDNFISSNVISLEMFLSVASETPCDIPLKTQSNKVGGTSSLLIHIYNEGGMGSQTTYGGQQSSQDNRTYGQQPQTGYPAAGYGQQPGGYPQSGYAQPSGYPQQGGYPQQAPYPQAGGYPQQGYAQAPYAGAGGYPQQYSSPYGQQPMQQQYQQQQPKKGGFGKMAPWLLAGGLGAGALGLGAYELGEHSGYDQGYDNGYDNGNDNDYGGGDYGGGDYGGGDFGGGGDF